MRVFIDVESRKTEETQEYLHTNYAKITLSLSVFIIERVWVCALQKTFS